MLDKTTQVCQVISTHTKAFHRHFQKLKRQCKLQILGLVSSVLMSTFKKIVFEIFP